MIKPAVYIWLVLVLACCKQDEKVDYQMVDLEGERCLLIVDSSASSVGHYYYSVEDTLLRESYFVRKSNEVFYAQHYDSSGSLIRYFSGIDSTVLFSANCTPGGEMVSITGDPYILYASDQLNSFCLGDSVYLSLVALFPDGQFDIETHIERNQPSAETFTFSVGDTLQISFIGTKEIIDTVRLYLHATSSDGAQNLNSHYSDALIHKADCKSP